MKTVLQVFRKPSTTVFSIEKVFLMVRPYLERKSRLDALEVPYYSNDLLSIYRNLKFLRKSRNADVYHVTGDVHYAVIALPKRKTILTIHDCVFLYSSRGLKRKILKWIFLDLPVSRSAIITTISDFSRQEILRFSKCDPGKIVVIPDPVNAGIVYREKAFNAGKPDILSIGFAPNKNLERVAQALEGIACKLHVVGKLSGEQERVLAAHGIDYNMVYNISEAALAQMYVDCDIVLFPSTFEGFGLPIIEGQKAGRVVITSNIEPMKSVAGKGAYLVDPLDINDIRKGVQAVIGDTVLRNSLIEAGFENTLKYDAGRIAEAYEQLYDRIAMATE